MQMTISRPGVATMVLIKHSRAGGGARLTDTPGRRRRLPEAHRDHRDVVSGMQLQRVLHLHMREQPNQ
jgi:hypothetical protein